MAKDIIMNVLTSVGYEPMYPFNPRQILNATFLGTSSNQQYNITIKGLPTPLTAEYGNDMGIISFIPTVNNIASLTVSINGGTPMSVLYANGEDIVANTFVVGRIAYLRYYNNNLYTLIDKSQIGLNNVDNTSDLNKPISTAVQNALESKLNTPMVIPRNSNLNTYNTSGLYYCPTTNDALTITNSPVSYAFSLFVEKHNGYKQTVTAFDPAGVSMWVRNSNAYGTWGDWYQVAMVSFGMGNPSGGVHGNIYIKYSN